MTFLETTCHYFYAAHYKTEILLNFKFLFSKCMDNTGMYDFYLNFNDVLLCLNERQHFQRSYIEIRTLISKLFCVRNRKSNN